MSKRDYYEVLGCQIKVPAKREIKKAYKKLAMKYHPDRTQGDKEALKKIQRNPGSLRSILTDPQKRASLRPIWSRGR